MDIGQQGGVPEGRPWHRSFRCLFVTQFQGAFSDNAYKFFLMYLILGEPDRRPLELLLLTGAVFALPFILFSMTAGMLADRFSKRGIAVATKVAEIGVMSLALAGLALGLVNILIVVMFLMCLQSTLFGPVKYGLIPEMVPPSRISLANGYLALGTFLAIIGGVVAAGILADFFGEDAWQSGLILVLLASVGFCASLGIEKVPAASPHRAVPWNPVLPLRARIREIREDAVLTLAIIGNSYFWFLGALMQFVVLMLGRETLALSNTYIGYLQGGMAVGIALGSLAAGYVSRGRVEYRLVPIGGLGLSVAFLLMALPQPDFPRILTLLLVLGFFGGLYAVPQMVIIQTRPVPERKGSILAVNNIIAFTGVFAASVVYYLCRSIAGLSDAGILIGCGLVTLPVALVILRQVLQLRR